MSLKELFFILRAFRKKINLQLKTTFIQKHFEKINITFCYYV